MMLCWLGLTANAQLEAGRVRRILSADKIEIRTADQRTLRVRLAGVTGPRQGQPGYAAACDSLQAKALGQWVDVKAYGRTPKGVLVADVQTAGAFSLSCYLAANGLAWYDPAYKTDTGLDTTLQQLSAQAQTHRQGLWYEDDPTPPWRQDEPTAAERAERRAFWGAVVADVIVNTLPLIVLVLMNH